MNNSEFWYDKVQQYKKTNRTQELINLCRKNIPLPAAFREIAIAMRKQIRVYRKNKQDYEILLKELYNNAVCENFFMSVNWNLVINLERMCSIAQPFIPRIECSYDEIGYEFLKQLTVTDVKWIVEKWGEPKCHSEAKDVNVRLWEEANETYMIEGKKEEAEEMELVERKFAEEERYISRSRHKKKSEISSFIGVVVILIILIYTLSKC